MENFLTALGRRRKFKLDFFPNSRKNSYFSTCYKLSVLNIDRKRLNALFAIFFSHLTLYCISFFNIYDDGREFEGPAWLVVVVSSSI